MERILYYISLPVIYLISCLPFGILYFLSDLLYLILYKILKYRVKIVRRNLHNAFPEKSQVELQQLEKSNYQYFCDLMLETLKTLTISPKSVRKRVQYGDMAVFDRYYRSQQSVILVMGHLGNWELAGARFSLEPVHQLFVIYRPLHNQYFDRLVYHMRTRLGTKLYAMKETWQGMFRNRNEITATAFIADQTPSAEGAYWTTFLNQDTPVYRGPAKIALKFNYPVIYVNIHRVRRGLHVLNAELLVENPQDYSEDELTELYTKRLEKDILANPEQWLWTHRRWKHQRI